MKRGDRVLISDSPVRTAPERIAPGASNGRTDSMPVGTYTLVVERAHRDAQA